MKITQNQIDTLRQLLHVLEEERLCNQEIGNIPRSEGEVMEQERQSRKPAEDFKPKDWVEDAP